MATQLEIPLFPPDMMDKIKDAHRRLEIEKLQREVSHLRHVRAGYIGAFKKHHAKNENPNNPSNNEL
jgi:hypothetical protein